MKYLISIIIPTYNRAHLIGETLDSIMAQTYENWECIIVDDGSTDDTEAILSKYNQSDSRILFYNRPSKHKSGGNGARNFGLEKAQGDYVIWFDSDDLMTPNHLSIKLDLVFSGNYDFAITRTKFFNKHNDVVNSFYNFKSEAITLENYVLQKINWLTYDIIIKESAARHISFDESLKCSQEYNYFSKLLYRTTNGVFKPEVVTLRRYDENSISETVRKSSQCKIISKWVTFLAVKENLTQEAKRKMMNEFYKNFIDGKLPSQVSAKVFLTYLIKYHGFFRGIIKIVYYYFSKQTSRFYSFRKFALR